MGFWLNIAIVIGVIGPMVRYHLYLRDFDGPRLSRKFIRKFTWGLRYFILPAICVNILLATNLRTFCFALACTGVFNICMRLLLGSDKTLHQTYYLRYVFYGFLYLTWSQNGPYWIQIWPTISASFFLIFFTLIGMFNKHQWLIPFWPDTLPRSQKLMFRTMLPFMMVWLLFWNEYFRRFKSFEVWATYNIFSLTLVILVVALTTIIIVTAIGEKRLAAFGEKSNSK